MKKIAYYIVPGLIDVAMEKIKVLSKEVKLYVFFEVSPKAWQHNLLDISDPIDSKEPESAKTYLRNNLPDKTYEYFKYVEEVNFVRFKDKYDCRGFLKAITKIIKIKPDYLIFEGESIRGSIIGLFTGIPIIANVHEPVVPNNKKALSLSIAKQIIIRKSKFIIVHSTECLKRLREYYDLKNKKISLLPLGTYDIYTTWISEIKEKYLFNDGKEGFVFFWGWLTKRKGVDVLIQAAKILKEIHPQIKIVIAGKPSENILQHYTENMDRNLKVIPRHLTNPELAYLLNACKFVVVPYREARQSGVIMTSFAFNKPVIASNVGGLKEQVSCGQTGILIEPGDKAILAMKIAKLWKDPNTLEQLCMNIRRIKAEDLDLSWAEYKNGILRLLNSD